MQEEKLFRKDFVFIIIINFLVFLNHLAILATFPFYIEALGGSEAVAGMAVALFCVVSVVCRPFIGWMLDNGKRKMILAVGLLGMLLMPLGYLFLHTLVLAFVCRMVHGAALAFSNTSTATIATDSVPRSRFAEGMGIFGLATALATAVAPAIGLALMEKYGFSVLFLFGSLSIALALVLFFLLKAPNIAVEKKPLSLKGLFDKNAVPASLTAVLSGFGFGGLEPALQSMAVAIAPPEKRGSANSTFLCAYDIGIGIGGAIAGGLISSFGYETMFTGMSVFNLLSIVIYVLIGRNHPSSFSYRKRKNAKA